MFRLIMVLTSMALLLWGCSSDTPGTCTGSAPNFVVVLKLAVRPLPSDTVVHVVYAGSGMEDFLLSDPHARHEVAFCQVADEKGVPLDPSAQPTMGDAGAGGAAGSGDSPRLPRSLYCQLWTAGFTELKVSGSGFPTKNYQLASKDGVCTLHQEYVLDSPDVD